MLFCLVWLYALCENKRVIVFIRLNSKSWTCWILLYVLFRVSWTRPSTQLNTEKKEQIFYRTIAGLSREQKNLFSPKLSHIIRLSQTILSTRSLPARSVLSSRLPEVLRRVWARISPRRVQVGACRERGGAEETRRQLRQWDRFWLIFPSQKKQVFKKASSAQKQQQKTQRFVEWTYSEKKLKTCV